MKALIVITCFVLVLIICYIIGSGYEDNLDNKHKKANPYKWIYKKDGWSQNQVNENNKKYWDWERKYNNFDPFKKKL